jgi:hypothetical protein
LPFPNRCSYNNKIYSRSIGGVDFARQLAEQNRSSNPSTKKFRSTAAPKGAKLPEGYLDRTKFRGDETSDEKAERVKALEEMMKLQQIDEATFMKLRNEILGGSVENTHLVKGLDWKLLERVKRGEDVLSGDKKIESDDPEGEGHDLEEEFDKLADREIKAVEKEKTSKKGEIAPLSLIPGKKRDRNQILAELKAARNAALEAKGPVLGAKFKRVGERRAEIRIEKDGKGREVLFTVDEHGVEKRKVRKVHIEEPELGRGHGLLMPDKDARPLGMEVPEIPKILEEEEDIDIFDDVGDDYDPLAGLGGDDLDSETERELLDDAEQGELQDESDKKEPETKPKGSMAPPPKPIPSEPRNYFGDSKPSQSQESTAPKAFSDPTILAALKKASTLNPLTKEAENAEETAKEERRKKMLQQDDRDAQDMDMGFGSSRFEDEEDLEDREVKLSEWGAGDDEDGGVRGKGKGKERKRGQKKRKGDVNSSADVLKIMERRKADS